MKPLENPVTISYISPEEFERQYGVWGDAKKAIQVQTHTRMGVHDTETSKRPRDKHMKITWEQLETELAAGSTISEIAAAYGISRTAIRLRMKKMGR